MMINVDHRCDCWRRVDFDIQCKHEMKLNLQFKLKHWGHRWYNRREFSKQYPNMSTFGINPEIIDVEDGCNDNTSINNSDGEIICLDENNSDDNDQQNNSDDNQDTVVFNSILDKHNSKVTYSDVLELATDLCRTVSDDPKLYRSTYATLFNG